MNTRRAVAGVTAGAALFTVLATNTYSAFTSELTHEGTATAGTVILSDNGAYAGSDLWNINNIKPGSTQSVCLAVTYTGSLDANVRQYITATSSMGPKFTLRLEEGTGAPTGPNNCTGFAASSTLYDGSLAAAPSTFNTGVGTGTWTNPTTKVYRYTVELASDADNSYQTAQSLTTVHIEARNI